MEQKQRVLQPKVKVIATPAEHGLSPTTCYPQVYPVRSQRKTLCPRLDFSKEITPCLLLEQSGVRSFY